MGMPVAVLPRAAARASTGCAWIRPRASVAHPLDDGRAVMLSRSLDATCAGLGRDGARVARAWSAASCAIRTRCCADLLGPLRIPQHPFAHGALRRCGAAFRADLLARRWFRDERARALFAGCAAHSILPLDAAAHRGGRRDLRRHGARRGLAGRARADPRRSRDALAELPRAASAASIETGAPRRRARAICRTRASSCSTPSPRQLARIAGDALPAGYRRRLAALPLRARRLQARLGARRADPVARSALRSRRRRCTSAARSRRSRASRARPCGAASTAERPFVLVVQQSHFDPTRAPGRQAHRLRLLPRAARLDAST